MYFGIIFEADLKFETDFEFEAIFEFEPKLKLNKHLKSIALWYVFEPTFEVQYLKVINPNEKCARNELRN